MPGGGGKDCRGSTPSIFRQRDTGMPPSIDRPTVVTLCRSGGVAVRPLID